MSTMAKVELTEVYRKFHVRTLAKKLLERRIILVQIKKYSVLVEKLHHLFKVFPDTELLFLPNREWIRIPIVFAAKVISEETDLNYSVFYTF